MKKFAFLCLASISFLGFATLSAGQETPATPEVAATETEEITDVAATEADIEVKEVK